MTKKNLPKVCIIGAGCAGFTTGKRLKDHNVPFDCYEASDDIGGNWYFQNPNGMSACYRSLHIDTSKWRMAFEDYPVPETWPDYPHHSLILQYFHDYVDHFDLRRNIVFNTRVEKASRRTDGCWEIKLSTGKEALYDALIVCNGHHWFPRMPEYPGTFDGESFHSHAYIDPFDPVDVRGKTVLVVGMGNSAMDIASEVSERAIAGKVFVSARRGVWVLPKYAGSQPLDKGRMPAWMPRWLGKRLAEHKISSIVGSMEDYGLPKPEHGMFESHGSVSSEFLLRAGSGDLTMKPGVERLDGDGVAFKDGTREDIDVIIWATGYDMSFPFFDDPALQPDAENRFPLFKRIMKPGVNNLFFMGLAQSVPTLVNFPEQQSQLVTAYLTGNYALPSEAEMLDIIQTDETYYLSQYYQSKRHTIQLDFDHYAAALRKELKRGAQRARLTDHALPVKAMSENAQRPSVSNAASLERVNA